MDIPILGQTKQNPIERALIQACTAVHAGSQADRAVNGMRLAQVLAVEFQRVGLALVVAADIRQFQQAWNLDADTKNRAAEIVHHANEFMSGVSQAVVANGLLSFEMKKAPAITKEAPGDIACFSLQLLCNGLTEAEYICITEGRGSSPA